MVCAGAAGRGAEHGGNRALEEAGLLAPAPRQRSSVTTLLFARVLAGQERNLPEEAGWAEGWGSSCCPHQA